MVYYLSFDSTNFFSLKSFLNLRQSDKGIDRFLQDLFHQSLLRRSWSNWPRFPIFMTSFSPVLSSYKMKIQLSTKWSNSIKGQQPRFFNPCSFDSWVCLSIILVCNRTCGSLFALSFLLVITNAVAASFQSFGQSILLKALKSEVGTMVQTWRSREFEGYGPVSKFSNYFMWSGWSEVNARDSRMPSSAS